MNKDLPAALEALARARIDENHAIANVMKKAAELTKSLEELNKIADKRHHIASNVRAYIENTTHPGGTSFQLADLDPIMVKVREIKPYVQAYEELVKKGEAE